MTENDYNKIKELGSGGYGKVWEVEDKKSKKRVAMKVIQIQDVTAEELKKIEQEAALTQRLNHPNVVKVTNSFVSKASNQYCILMELAVYGLDKEIAKWRNDPKLVSVPKVLNYFTQILDAVSYCHKQNIIHRDLKPENILMFRSTEPNTYLPKLCDFGCATLMENKSKTMKTTGTLNYMAPEMFDNKPYSYSVDIWALGCILFEMVTTCQAFPGQGQGQVVLAVVKAKVDYTKVPTPELQQLIKKMLNKEVIYRAKIDQLVKEPLLQSKQVDSRQQQWRQLVQKRKLEFTNEEPLVDLQSLTDTIYDNKADIDKIVLDCSEILRKLTSQFLYEQYSVAKPDCIRSDFEGDPIQIINDYFTSDQIPDLINSIESDMQSNISVGEALAVMLYTDRIGQKVKFQINTISSELSKTYNQLKIYQCNAADKQFIEQQRQLGCSGRISSPSINQSVNDDIEEQKRQLEEQRRQIEEEKRKLDEEKREREEQERERREEEDRKRQEEDERRRKEEERKREDERRRKEADERKRQDDEKKRKDAEKQKQEEQNKRSQNNMPIELRYIDKLEDDGVYIESVEKPNYYICIKNMNIKDASKFRFHRLSNGLMIINVYNKLKLSCADSPSHAGSQIVAAKDLNNCVWPIVKTYRANIVVLVLDDGYALESRDTQLVIADTDKYSDAQRYHIHVRQDGKEDDDFDPDAVKNEPEKPEENRDKEQQDVDLAKKLLYELLLGKEQNKSNQIKAKKLCFQDEKVEDVEYVYIFPLNRPNIALAAMGETPPKSQWFELEKISAGRYEFTNVATRMKMGIANKPAKDPSRILLSNELPNTVFTCKEVKDNLYFIIMDDLVMTVMQDENDNNRLTPGLTEVEKGGDKKQLFIMIRGKTIIEVKRRKQAKELVEQCEGM